MSRVLVAHYLMSTNHAFLLGHHRFSLKVFSNRSLKHIVFTLLQKQRIVDFDLQMVSYLETRIPQAGC